MRLKGMWCTLPRTSVSFWSSKEIESLLRRANSQISRKTSRRRIQEIPHHLKWSRALSALSDLQLFCVCFNSMPNLIVILFNLLYPVFYVVFLCKGYVWERVWRLKAKWRAKKFSRVVRKKPSCEVKYVLSTWLECKELWQMVIASFRECLVGKAFSRDTRETFCFTNLSYLIYQDFTHTIYTHITHIL